MKEFYKKYLFYFCMEIFIIILGIIICRFTLNTDLMNCLFYKEIGILCPSCGGTRCFINFLQFNFKEAYKFNKLFFITFIYIILLNISFMINIIIGKEKIKFLYLNNKKIIIYSFFWFFWGILRNMLIFK